MDQATRRGAMGVAACVVCLAALAGCGGESSAETDQGSAVTPVSRTPIPAALLEEYSTADLEALVAVGSRVYVQQNCGSCHVDPSNETLGPSLYGIAGTTVRLDDGSEVERTSGYLYRSIVSPQESMVAGHDDSMISYSYLDERSLIGLVKYIESLELSDVPAPADPASSESNGGSGGEGAAGDE